MNILNELEISHVNEWGDYPGDLPERIWVHPEYDYLGWYEQLGGHSFGLYWGELEYHSDSHGGEDLVDDIKIASEECDALLLAECNFTEADDGGVYACYEEDNQTYTRIKLETHGSEMETLDFHPVI